MSSDEFHLELFSYVFDNIFIVILYLADDNLWES